MGLVASIHDVFQHCNQQAKTNPFELSSLNNIETVLERLIEEGMNALLVKGRRNRLWIEENWSFAKQWRDFWIPSIEQAFDKVGKSYGSILPPPLLKKPPISERQTRHSQAQQKAILQSPLESGTSIIIPFGGLERLPLLQAVLKRLKSCDGIERIIVVEMGAESHAKAIGSDLADDYIFAYREQAFNKSAVMNMGLPFVRSSHFMWLDSDLLLPQDFVIMAHKECINRDLDCLIPWDTVFFMSENDSREVIAGTRCETDCKGVHHFRIRQGAQGATVIVRTEFALQYGGMFEQFQGWGGEDNAWFYKVKLLGRIDYTLNRQRHIHHLFHANSSGYCRQGEHIAANPNYDNNFKLLKRIRSIRTSATLMNIFPPSEFHSCPWQGKKQVYCTEPNKEAGKILQNLYGDNSISICADEEQADISLTTDPVNDSLTIALQAVLQLTNISV
ncbi:MAG: glycosyltransferase family 2 protein [Aestuariibacter sp.]|nr:glycosyltransferase family 2 protein [Aestuariibacter sp.]